MLRFFLLLMFLTAFAIQSFASDYPKSKTEREMDEMGSILQGEGLVFRPKKTKNSASPRNSQ